MAGLVERRFAPVEIRQDGGRTVIEGPAMRYGDTADIAGMFSERFERGAFGDVAALDVIANVQHERGRPIGRTQGGGLTLADSAEALRVVLELPNTRDGADAAELLRLRVLRGFSIEFSVPANGDRFDRGTRIVSRANLSGLGVVDRPAYGDALAEIAKRAEGLSADVPRRRVWF